MVKKLRELNKKDIKLQNNEIIIYYIMIFFIGCICGWIYEEIFHFIKENEIVNRGFLYGPYLPVYGFGACILISLLRKLKKHPIIFFLSCILITGIIEYITGYILMEIWHKRWWDYTGLFMDIHGYVCLRSVLTFGIGGLLLLYIFDPIVKEFVHGKTKKKALIFSIVFSIIIIIDIIITLLFRHPI